MSYTTKFTKVEGKYVYDADAIKALILADVSADPAFTAPDMEETGDLLAVVFYNEAGTAYSVATTAKLELVSIDVEGEGTTPVTPPEE